MTVLSNKSFSVQSIMNYSQTHTDRTVTTTRSVHNLELQSKLTIMDLQQSTNETNKNNSTIWKVFFLKKKSKFYQI